MFRGPNGTGKSTALLALMQAIAGDGYPGFVYKSGQELKIDEIKSLWAWLECSFLCPKREHFHVLCVEELAKLSPECSEWIKCAFDVCLPERAVILCTSNDISKLHPAVVDRFEHYLFHDSPVFRTDSAKRALRVWQEVLTEPFGVEAPQLDKLVSMGMRDDTFSFRTLLQKMEQKLQAVKHNSKPLAQRQQEANEHAERIGL